MSEPLIVYQIDLELKPAIVDAYAAWLKEHVTEILALPGFLRAEVLEEPARATDDLRCFSVRFVLRDRDSLENYLREHAPRLRNQGAALFEGAFSSSRRVYVVRQSHSPRIG